MDPTDVSAIEGEDPDEIGFVPNINHPVSPEQFDGDDYFGARWKGCVWIEGEGVYTFALECDDE
eukprot:2962341-Amphidinium_carterae.2